MNDFFNWQHKVTSKSGHSIAFLILLSLPACEFFLQAQARRRHPSQVHELDIGPSRDPTVETPKMKYRSLRSDPLMRVGGLGYRCTGSQWWFLWRRLPRRMGECSWVKRFYSQVPLNVSLVVESQKKYSSLSSSSARIRLVWDSRLNKLKRRDATIHR